MRIIQRCIFYSFLREITTKPRHWPCHLERSQDDKKKNRATGATEDCKLLTARRSTVQDRLKIELLSCTDGATEKHFGATMTLGGHYWEALLRSLR